MEMDRNEWTQIGKVQAFDLDTGDNARLKYELTVGNLTAGVVAADAFRIGESSGLIEAKRAVIDHELAEQFELTVVARDNVQGSLSGVSHRAEVGVVVRVGDVNDHRPVFEQAEYRFEIVENLAGVKFGGVRATDADRARSGSRDG
jgi:hypothetical protein